MTHDSHERSSIMMKNTNTNTTSTTALVLWIEWNLQQIVMLGCLHFWLLDRAEQNTEN